MFSPTGKPTLFHGQRSNIEDVIAKFSQLTPQERAKRKLESLEALKKTFKKLDHDVNIQEFLGACQTVEELMDQSKVMQVQLSELHKRLSYWSNPDKIENVEQLSQMEESLRESVNRIRLHKENLAKCQFMPLECANQFQNGMALPLMMSGLQEAQPLSWLPNGGNQQLLLSSEPNFLQHADMECSTDTSIPGYSGYFSADNKTDIGTSTSVDNMGQEGGAPSDLSSNVCLSSQVGEQFSYHPYGNLDMPDNNKLKPEMEMNVQGSPAVYPVNNNFELPRPLYDNVNHAWVSAPAPCEIAMFHGNTYHQQSN